MSQENLIIEHYKFFNRKQKEGEAFDEFYRDLKKAITSCELGDIQDDILKSQIIIGIYNKNIQLNFTEGGDETGKGSGTLQEYGNCRKGKANYYEHQANQRGLIKDIK